ncbi:MULTISPECIES: DNA-binding transcriptional regulator [Acetobacter]|uniref:Transcriptional regulator n=1 Tax=Acetobacter pomorum TaxID=65959 RepID=A0AAN1PKP3_9PROT|nr:MULTISPECIES: transcriptional regulator [Acetobacter]AXN01965.1 transcriptional regulator [Acetobacter pomorum]KAA8396032.1 transcriptional regulator [Acetobacter sp. DmW_125128]KAA8396808.1 transcriptional regulator [Acetobacter sp. DmW_125124]KAA8400225.1 transcriptional regulator [Acetobacter sp. DmW_125127]KAA8402069.1 transcriptional regulator [Acetobacter sp. DmW_125133]
MAEQMNIADELLTSMEQAVGIAEGAVKPGRVWTPPEINVADIRKRTGLSQVRFAARYGFSAAAVRDWEQKRRTPEKAARTLLMLIDKEPQAVERVLVGA